MIPHKKCNKSYSKHFFVKCTIFCMKGVKGFKKCDFAGDVKFLLFIRFWWGFLHLFFPEWFLMKKLTKRTTFEDNMSQNNLLSSHITVSSILLCPALYCVQLYTVSNTLLCPAHYCVQQHTVSTLTQSVFCSPFTFQCAAVVSCCACEAPLFKNWDPKLWSTTE